MPVCKNCGREWSWKESLKSSFTLDYGVKCPHCGNKQFITVKSKKRMMYGNFLILLPLLLNIFFDLSALLLIGLMVLIFVGVIVWMPRQMELTDEDEQLW